MTCVDGALRCRVRCRSASGFGRPSRCRDDTTPHPTHVKLGSIRESGRPDSNRRPPRPKRGALTRLSYAPLSEKCTHGVAVRTHHFALRDLLEAATLARPRPQIRHVGRLLEAWLVIPLHRGGVEDAAAVSARPSLLEARVPSAER